MPVSAKEVPDEHVHANVKCTEEPKRVAEADCDRQVIGELAGGIHDAKYRMRNVESCDISD